MLGIRTSRTKQTRMNTPRAPCEVSLAELLTLGLISEDAVQQNGHVSEDVRRAAEREYMQRTPRRPSTAPPVSRIPSTRPPPMTPRPLPRTTRTSSAHIHRLQLRRDNAGTERTPRRTALDTCCICYAKDRTHAVDPCFHLCVCESCAARITKCPIGREEIVQMRRIFL